MRLRDLREDADLTQQNIADFLNISQNTYSQYEREERQIPIPLLIKLCLFYNTSADYILGYSNNPNPYPRSKKYR